MIAHLFLAASAGSWTCGNTHEDFHADGSYVTGTCVCDFEIVLRTADGGRR